MALFETALIESTTVKIRVKAESKEQAEYILHKFNKTDPGYLADELDLNGDKIWTWKELTPCNPAKWDEAATIIMREDGSFDAEYQGGDA